MVASSKTLLGHGLYTVSEAAFYARMHWQTLHAWLFGGKEQRPVLQSDFGDEKLVSFVTFVEALAVRAIRLTHKIPLDKIRQAVQNAEKRHGMSHLLARQHAVYVFDKEIFVAPPGEKPLAQVTGKHVDSQIMPVLELHLKDIWFDEQGLAGKYRVFQWGGVEIWMNPRISFGEPLLPSGYTVMALWEANRVEGSIKRTAKAYGVTEEEVNLACRCYDHLIGPAAA